MAWEVRKHEKCDCDRDEQVASVERRWKSRLENSVASAVTGMLLLLLLLRCLLFLVVRAFAVATGHASTSCTVAVAVAYSVAQQQYSYCCCYYGCGCDSLLLRPHHGGPLLARSTRAAAQHNRPPDW